MLCNGRLETRVTPNKEGIPPQKTTNVVLGKQLSPYGNRLMMYLFIYPIRDNLIDLVYKQNVFNTSMLC